MLPIVDKPLIQYAVEEAVAAGITQMIFVTSNNKRAIEDHFDSNYELEMKLAEKGKTQLLDSIKNMLPKGIQCVYVRQPESLGLGHAVLCAKELVGDEPFAVLLADDLINSANQGCMAQLVDEYNKHKNSVIAVETIAKEDTDKYGIVDINQNNQLNAIIEKPKPQDAPSNLAAIGRYILTPRIFHHLEQIKPGAGDEIQLTDAIAALLSEQAVYAHPFEGVRYDCGSKLGYLQATVKYALKHPSVAERFERFLKELSN
jgi:UTP--glucose-1-phosphate uridylyltransferase